MCARRAGTVSINTGSVECHGKKDGRKAKQRSRAVHGRVEDLDDSVKQKWLEPNRPWFERLGCVTIPHPYSCTDCIVSSPGELEIETVLSTDMLRALSLL